MRQEFLSGEHIDSEIDTVLPSCSQEPVFSPSSVDEDSGPFILAIFLKIFFRIEIYGDFLFEVARILGEKTYKIFLG